jgi:hypothetical protein
MNQEKTIVFLGDADQRENVEETKDRKARSICRGPVQVEGRSFEAGVVKDLSIVKEPMSNMKAHWNRF